MLVVEEEVLVLVLRVWGVLAAVVMGPQLEPRQLTQQQILEAVAVDVEAMVLPVHLLVKVQVVAVS